MRLAIPLACLAVTAAAPALAQSSEAEAARAPFRACGQFADRDERLACFDRALGQGAAEPKPKSAEFGLAGSPAERQQRLRTPPEQRPVEQERAELEVLRASADGLGRWTIEASTGAAWRQIESVPSFRPPRKGQAVSVRKGALGGYMLRVGDQPLTRVERIR